MCVWGCLAAPVRPIAVQVVENSFTSISAMVDAKFPFLNVPYFKVGHNAPGARSFCGAKFHLP